MPSFMTDDNSHIFANNADILNLDPNNQFGLATGKERLNGGSIRHARTDTIGESFDESSISSTHASEISESNPPPVNGTSEGSGTRPTSMSSMQNGKMVDDGSRTGAGTRLGGGAPAANDDFFTHKSLANGTTTTLVDRSRIQQPPSSNGTIQPRTNSIDAQSGYASSTPVASEQHLPSESQDASKRSIDAIANGHSTTSLNGDARASYQSQMSQSHLAPGSVTPDLTQGAHRSPGSGHRLSSPPVYPSGNTAAASSGHLHPAPHPGALKQRHTLEVPKATPGRGSKDGLDTAQASGRFSPTGTLTGGRRASLSLARRNTRSMHSDMPRDEAAPDEDAMRWAEAYRQKRASKRKRKEEEDDDRVLVGTKVDETHANWVTAYNMLTGIRVSVSRTNAKLDRELTDADFDTKQKSTFDM